MQRFVDAWMAFPGLLLLLTIMSIVGRGLLQTIMVLGLLGGISGSRVMRSAVIGIKENDYFQAARAVGTPTGQILTRHVLPNIMAPVIIVFSINIGGVILSLASLASSATVCRPASLTGAACSAGKGAGTWSKPPGWPSGQGCA